MSRVFVLVAALLLTACSGWDKPIYQSEPANGDFLLGTWIAEKDGVFRIFVDQDRYFALLLDEKRVTLIPLYLTQHRDVVFLNADLASARGLSVNEANDKRAAGEPAFEILSAKKTEQGIVFAGIDKKALGKLLADRGVTSTDELCRSVWTDDRKDDLNPLERCNLINTVFVERVLGDTPMPLQGQALAKPVHYQ